MSNIVGNYVNAALNAKLTIATANDSNGAITGTLSLGATQMSIAGTWNASTVAPNGVFTFTGASLNPTKNVGGAGQTADFNSFSSISLGFAVSQKDTQTMIVAGTFIRA
jgi:hypothetical protein